MPCAYCQALPHTPCYVILGAWHWDSRHLCLQKCCSWNMCCICVAVVAAIFNQCRCRIAAVYPLQAPLPLLADLGTGACAFDLSLPNPEFAVSSLANKLRFISSAISKAAFGKCDEECAASRHAAAVAEAVKSGTDMPLTLVSFSSLRAIHPKNPECYAFFASILFQPLKQALCCCHWWCSCLIFRLVTLLGSPPGHYIIVLAGAHF